MKQQTKFTKFTKFTIHIIYKSHNSYNLQNSHFCSSIVTHAVNAIATL